MDSEVKKHPARAFVALAIALSLGGVLTWLLFRFVVTDADLALDYVRALAWPTVVVAAMYWLRQPIREKLRELLRVEALGASAEFREARTRSFEADAFEDVAALLSDPDRGGEPESALLPNGEGQLTNGTETPTADDGQVREAAAESLGGQTSDVHTNGRLLPAHAEDLTEVLKQLGVTPEIQEELAAKLTGEDPDDARGQVIHLVRSVTNARLHALQAQADARQEQTRQSIESVISKSAEWGYDMGKAGAPKATPDIEWHEDGTWHITTTVPAKAYESTPYHRPSLADRRAAASRRHIETLEKEIRERESKHSSPMSRMALAGIGIDPYLDELKARLQEIDPGNPFAMTGSRFP